MKRRFLPLPKASYAKGVTLLELLIAVAMVSITVAMLSLLFPKASKSITNNRQHWLATNFATARIQDLKQQPYSLVTPTAAGNYFLNTNNALPPACDCSSVNWCTLGTALGPDATYTEKGITYTRQVCINLADRSGGAWTSSCPDNTSATDKGLKNIWVRVYWVSGSDVFHADEGSLVTR